jgi:hypothetical protein
VVALRHCAVPVPPASHAGHAAPGFSADYGSSLWTVYAVTAAVVTALYPLCLWFARVRQRRRDWWLGYL